MGKTYTTRKQNYNSKTRKRHGGVFSSNTMNKYKMPSMAELNLQGKKLADKHYQAGINSVQKHANNLSTSTSSLYNKHLKTGTDMYNKQLKTGTDMYNKHKYGSPSGFIAAKTLESTASIAKSVGKGVVNKTSNKMQPHIDASKKYMTSFTPNFSSKNTTLALERSKSGPTVSSAYNPTVASVPIP
jgi:hypothetical protein